MINNVIKTGFSLSEYLDSVIEESFKSALHQKALQEKEKQDATSDLFGGDGDDEGKSGEQASSKTIDDESEKLKKENIEPDDIIDKLNAIRSGKSFKEENIAVAMDEYVGSLSKAEKTALLAFLKGIAQIVTGEVTPASAVDPHTPPAEVEMQKGHKQQTKHIKPNVIKASPPKPKSKPGAEDTSAPVPITPKKK